MNPASCRHDFHDDREPCPHLVPAGASECLWHNQEIVKSPEYVRELLAHAVQHSGGDLEETHLAGLTWPNAPLAYARMARVDLRDAQLPGADLTGVDLRGAILKRANLQGARLSGARLDGADLTQTHLGGADLRDAELVGARFDATVLLGADLRNANLKDAEVVELRWNGHTRFSGLRGMEARSSSSSTDATQRYLTPAALGDAGASQDPDRTRIYRPTSGAGSSAAQSAASPQGAAATVAGAPIPEPLPGPGNDQLVSVNRRLRLALVAAMILAVAGAVGSLLLTWQLQQQPVDPSGKGPVANGTIPPELLGPELAEDQRLALRSEIDRLTEALTRAQVDAEQASNRLRQEAGRFDALLADERQGRRLAELDADRLRADQDQADALQRELNALTTRHRALLTRNAHLEQTAEILVEGVSRLEAENAVFEERSLQQLATAAQLEELREENQTIAGELDGLRSRLDRSENLREELTEALHVAKTEMDRLAQAVQGTELEDLLMGNNRGQEPLLRITRGEPVVLAGDYLITLTVDEQANDSSGIVTRMTLQGPSGDPLPDISLVLYTGPDDPARKVTYGFPDQNTERGFASASTVVEMDRFPTHARVILAPARDGEQLLGARRTPVQPGG